jgi:tripartite-type tricarboxylate transporter receptor subunit TctC
MKARILVLVSYVLMAVSVGLTPQMAIADEYPSKPVELIVTYAPGGSTDTTARTVSPMASELLGQPLVVINKPGAGGALALSSVAKASPDGYTLVIFAINAPILNAINAKAGFDSVKDFAPICNFIKQANILVVPADSKITSVAEYVKAAKANPGKLVAGSSGVGSSQHFPRRCSRRSPGWTSPMCRIRGVTPV